MDISTHPYKEILILIMGPIAQILAYTFLSRITIHQRILNYYHYGILFFNLLPIIPLDGGRLLNIVLNYFLPYRKTLYLSVIISYALTIGILFINNTFSISMIVTYIVLVVLVHKEEIKISIHFHKFILERLLKEYRFKKTSYIKNEKKMFRYRNNVFKINNTLIEEKEYLMKKYLT